MTRHLFSSDSGTPLQCCVGNGILKGAMFSTGLRPFFFQLVIPASRFVGIVDHDKLGVLVEPLLLLVDDVAVLFDKLANEGANERADQRQPRDCPVEHLVQFHRRVGQRSQSGQADDAVLTRDDVFDAGTGQLKTDLGRDFAE